MVLPIHTSPISAYMTELPAIIDDANFLLGAQFSHDQKPRNAKIHAPSVFISDRGIDSDSSPARSIIIDAASVWTFGIPGTLVQKSLDGSFDPSEKARSPILLE